MTEVSLTSGHEQHPGSAGLGRTAATDADRGARALAVAGHGARRGTSDRDSAWAAARRAVVSLTGGPVTGLGVLPPGQAVAAAVNRLLRMSAA